MGKHDNTSILYKPSKFPYSLNQLRLEMTWLKDRASFNNMNIWLCGQVEFTEQLCCHSLWLSQVFRALAQSTKPTCNHNFRVANSIFTYVEGLSTKPGFTQ